MPITDSESPVEARAGEALIQLRTALGELAEVPEAEWLRFSRGVAQVALARGCALVRQERAVDELWFLVRGLVHIVRSEPADPRDPASAAREVTLGFDCERRFVGAYDAYLARAPARYSVVALEPCELVRLPRALLERLRGEHPCWELVHRRAAEKALLQKSDKELRLRTLSPRERYETLVRAGSYLVQRVPQYLLASYLGVAPETLSRIRARIGGAS